jgi:hypothetical protein
MAGSFKKDPSAILDYGFDWTAWLGADTIAVSDWTIAGPDTSLTLTPDRPVQADAHSTLCWLHGGTAGVTYDLTNRVTTVGGRVDDRTVKIVVVQK